MQNQDHVAGGGTSAVRGDGGRTASVIDRELLELAAKAIGKQGQFVAPKQLDAERWGLCTFLAYGSIAFWNPLTDDGDALRLAVKLGMSLDTALGQTLAIQPVRGRDCVELHNGDPYAATRRAIVRAAAAMGKALPSAA